MALFERLSHLASTHGARQFLVEESRHFTFHEINALGLSVAHYLRRSGPQSDRVYFYAKDSALLVAALCGAATAGMTACVLNRDYPVNDLVGLINGLGQGHLFTDVPPEELAPVPAMDIQKMVAEAGRQEGPRGMGLGSDLRPSVPQTDAKIVVLTSGTTGAPKAVSYTWDRLFGQVRQSTSLRSARWLLAYPLNHFAGIQMLVHCLSNGHALVIPESREPHDVIKAILKHDVDSVSGTPTFWRLLIGRMTASEQMTLRLKQITLGGEPTTAELLGRLLALFPHAKVTQVYATTELGSCFAVNDNRPGFPADYLERQVGNVRLKVLDGELYIHSPNRMLGYVNHPQREVNSRWLATGDLVEIVGDRVYFRGRKSETINVGGVKVHPALVEEVILKVNGVQAVRVYGKANPITGQIVVAELQVASAYDSEQVVNNVRHTCRRHLSKYEQPRVFEFKEHIPRINEKIVRRQA